MHRGVFLDRDDTLVVNRALPVSDRPGARPGDLFEPERVALLPGAAEACLKLKSVGFMLIIVTNQGSVARGAATLDEIEATNDRVLELLDEEANTYFLVDAVYSCPYHPEGTVEQFAFDHEWRKPNPGMILAGADEFELDLSASWLIGDAQRDIEAAIAAGIPPEQALRIGDEAEHANVLAAAEHILATFQ